MTRTSPLSPEALAAAEARARQLRAETAAALIAAAVRGVATLFSRPEAAARQG